MPQRLKIVKSRSGMEDASDITHDEVQPASPSELARVVADNFREHRRPLYPLGGRTALHYGRPVTQPGVVISTGKLSGTIDYPARDMTVTVESGMRVDDLAELLKAEGQQLPIDVSQSNRATLGGAIATNTSGPRRFGYGTFRDYVIGISAVDASGRSFKAGGRVVKNVAGYDLCKLLIGSLGTLGIISQVTLKLKPLPERLAILWMAFPLVSTIETALQRLTGTSTRPILLDVFNPIAATQIAAESRLDLPCEQPVLTVAFDGTEAEVQWQIDAVKQELTKETPASIEVVSHRGACALLNALTEFPVPTEEPMTFRAAVPPSSVIGLLAEAEGTGISISAHAGNGVIYGHLADDIASPADAQRRVAPFLAAVERSRGGFEILNCADTWKAELMVFGTPSRAWPLMQKLKAQLDPHNLLNPGRLFGA